MNRTLAPRLLQLALLAGAMASPAHAQHHAMPATAGVKGALVIGAAFAPNGQLWVLEQDSAARLTLQTSADDGKSWSAGRVLDTGADRLNVSGENTPKLLFGPDGVVLISYEQQLAQRFTSMVRLLRSTDGGARFGAPVTLHADRQLIGHSHAALSFDGQGRLHALWLDGREMAQAKALAAEHGQDKPDYRGSAVYRTVSHDGGASFGPDIKLSDYSCECCRIALAPAPQGELAALWRHVTAPNIRDHAFAVLGDGAGAPPVRASFDNWAIDGCPHHGPSLTPATGGGYHALWFGERDGVSAVRYGKLDRAGHPAGAVQALPDTGAEHADILGAGARLAIVWRSFDGKGTRARAWLSDDDGAHFVLRELARTDGENDYPRLLARGEQLFVIWNTKGKRHVQAL
jgi:hypothetical protein